MKTRINKEDVKRISCGIDSQETTIVITKKDDMMSIYTSDPVMLAELKKAISDDWVCYELDRRKDGRVSGYMFEAPKDILSIKHCRKSRKTTK